MTKRRWREPKPQGGNQGPKGHKFRPKSNGGPMDIARGMEIGAKVSAETLSRANRIRECLRCLGAKGKVRHQPDRTYTVERVA